MSVTRYDVYLNLEGVNSIDGDAEAEMRIHPQGDYVSYDEYLDAVTTLRDEVKDVQAERDQLENELDSAREDLNSANERINDLLDEISQLQSQIDEQ